MKKIISLISILILTYNISLAHTMWIEVGPSASKGKEQTIKVFFGDFSWEAPTPTAKWFSDIKEYTLYMQQPDGTIVTVENKIQDSLHYTNSFMVTQEGVYTFWLRHEVKDVYKEKKLTYASAAFVSIGKKGKAVLGKESTQFQISNTKKPNEIVYLINGKPAANEVVTIIPANNKGATLTLTTDAKGKLIFPKDWKGAYLIEMADSKKVPATDHNGKEYQFDYQEFTYRVEL